MIKNIEVHKQMKTNSNNNSKFPIYSAKMADGKWMQMKFTRECNADAITKGFTIPQTENDKNRFIIVVDTVNCNVSKNGLYNVAWVKKVEEVKDIVVTNDFDNLF